jgi:hypothetical protein
MFAWVWQTWDPATYPLLPGLKTPGLKPGTDETFPDFTSSFQARKLGNVPSVPAFSSVSESLEENGSHTLPRLGGHKTLKGLIDRARHLLSKERILEIVSLASFV